MSHTVKTFNLKRYIALGYRRIIHSSGFPTIYISAEPRTSVMYRGALIGSVVAFSVILGNMTTFSFS